MTTPAQRLLLHEMMRQLILSEPKVHYAETRPMETVAWDWPRAQKELAKRAGVTVDCSEAVTALCKWAGLQDPNGLHYDGQGFTGTLLQNLPHYKQAKNAMTGALVVFGPDTGEHVCMVMEPGLDPLLWSHGQERGPIAIRLSVERHFHNTPVTLLSIAKLG